MGKLDIDPLIQHFSHPHVLKLLNFQSETLNTVTCAGCNLHASGWMYNCSSCNYYLHKACSQMPQHKKHQVDPNHTLTLLPLPVYSQGAFKCNACGKNGTRFCYHCKDCKLDLHTLCAHMPASITISTHHHTLDLCFYPPYQKKRFQCYICGGSGSNHWLYHCGPCNFDAHLNCAVASVHCIPSLGIHHHHQQQQQQKEHQLMKSPRILSQFPKPINNFMNPVPSIYHFSPCPTIPVAGSSSRSQPVEHMTGYEAGVAPVLALPEYFQPPRTNSMSNNLAGILEKGVVDGIAQQAGQILLGSILGGLSFF